MNKHRIDAVFLFTIIFILFSTSCQKAESSNDQEIKDQPLLLVTPDETAVIPIEIEKKEKTENEVITPQDIKEEQEIDPIDLPEELPEIYRTLEDSNSSYFAKENRIAQGDNFITGVFERPFTAKEMIYQPDLDILEVDFAPGDRYFFFTIHLYGENILTGGLQGDYSIEFDRDLDGRGDLLVVVKNPSDAWSMNNITVFGNEKMTAVDQDQADIDTGLSENEYGETIVMQGERKAYSRIDPIVDNSIQFAISYSLIQTPEKFLWGAWADGGYKDPSRYGYNNIMNSSVAGSPYLGKDYPLKALHSVDNTCKLPFGMAQSGKIPGMCKIGIPISPEVIDCPKVFRCRINLNGPLICEWIEICD